MGEAISYCPMYWTVSRASCVKGEVPIASPERKRYQKAASVMR